MIHAWSVDAIASLGASRGLGNVGYGTMQIITPDGIVSKGEDQIERGDRPADLPDEPTLFDTGRSNTTIPLELGDSSKPLARSHLITLDDADRMLEAVARRALVQFNASLFSRPGYRYRKLACGMRSQARMELMVAIAKQDCLLNCYPTRAQKKGVQCISTSRRSSTMPVGSYFKFNGKPAWRQPRGRPPLPENEWLKRYRKRRAKAKKTTRKIKKWVKRKKLNSAPALSRARPPRIFNLKCDANGYRDVLLSRAEEQSAADFYEREELLAALDVLDWSGMA
jgi:hypothetical protein